MIRNDEMHQTSNSWSQTDYKKNKYKETIFKHIIVKRLENENKKEHPEQRKWNKKDTWLPKNQKLDWELTL